MGHSLPSLVQFEEVYEPTRKNCFYILLFAKFANFRMKYQLFFRQAIEKIIFGFSL